MTEITVDPLTQGKYYIKKHEFKRAEEEFLKEIEKNPQSVEGWYLIAYCRRTLYRYEDALEAAEKAVKFGPENPDALFELTQVYRNMGKPDEAMKLAIKMETIEECRKAFNLDKLKEMIQKDIEKLKEKSD